MISLCIHSLALNPPTLLCRYYRFIVHKGKLRCQEVRRPTQCHRATKQSLERAQVASCLRSFPSGRKTTHSLLPFKENTFDLALNSQLEMTITSKNKKQLPGPHKSFSLAPCNKALCCLGWSTVS